jgi:hypothetical protein
MRTLLLTAVLLLPMLAAAQSSDQANPPADQTPAPTPAAATVALPLTLEQELKHLAAESETLHNNLPNFTCKETAISQAIRKNKVREQVNFVADLRVQRGNQRSDETFRVIELNGKPFQGGRFDSPLMVQGGFDQALDYFRPAMQACYRYTLSANRLDFVSIPDVNEQPFCAGRGGAQGFALLNASGDVTHIERRVTPQDAAHFGLAIFASVDLLPVELNGKTYPLSSKMVAELPNGKQTGRFEATYTNCTLFKATIKIVPGSTAPPDPDHTPNDPPPNP